MANEHPTNRTAGAVSAQIGGNGFSHIDWQGHEDGLATLAANGYQAFLPIDVLQVQPDNFAGSKSKPGKQQQNRVVPSADGRLPTTTIEYPLHRVCGKKLGEDRELPFWNGRHAGRQVGRHVPAVQQISEERAKRCDHQGGPPGAELTSVVPHKIGHIDGTNRGQVENLARKSLG
jgi:hypothetical protein